MAFPISLAEVEKFLSACLSWSHGFTAAAGAFLHKAWLWLKAKLAAAEADAKAAAAKIEADAKKL